MKNSKKSRTIEKFAKSSADNKIKKAFKWAIFGFCVVLTIVYTGQLKGHITIPFIAPGDQ